MNSLKVLATTFVDDATRKNFFQNWIFNLLHITVSYSVYKLTQWGVNNLKSRLLKKKTNDVH